jgi:hypothetical protein
MIGNTRSSDSRRLPCYTAYRNHGTFRQSIAKVHAKTHGVVHILSHGRSSGMAHASFLPTLNGCAETHSHLRGLHAPLELCNLTTTCYQVSECVVEQATKKRFVILAASSFGEEKVRATKPCGHSFDELPQTCTVLMAAAARMSRPRWAIRGRQISSKILKE